MRFDSNKTGAMKCSVLNKVGHRIYLDVEHCIYTWNIKFLLWLLYIHVWLYRGETDVMPPGQNAFGQNAHRTECLG